MEKFLSGKTALVTGAARGIGKAIAKTLLDAGAAVAFSDMAAPEAIAETEKELSALGKVKGYRSDASDFSAAEALITSVCTDFGTVDIMVNNAGITRDTLLMRMSEQQ